jgi:hypothetical protein
VPPPLPVFKETMIEGRATTALAMEPADGKQSRKLLLVSLLFVGLVTLSAVIVFRLKTNEGILVVEVNEPNAEVFVDGNKATVTWADGGKKAEIRIPPGRHEVEVKKDGFTVHGEKVDIEEGKRRVLSARLIAEKPDAKVGDGPPTADGVGDYDRTGGYRFVHFGKDRTRVVLRYYDKQGPHFARVYDLAIGNALTPPLKHDNIVRNASFSPDGKRVVTASDDKTARLWDAATGMELKRVTIAPDLPGGGEQMPEPGRGFSVYGAPPARGNGFNFNGKPK